MKSCKIVFILPRVKKVQKWRNLLVLLSIIRKDKILQLNFNLDPLIVGQSWPNVMRLCDSCFVWFQHNLGSLCVDVERSQNEDQS